MQYFLVLQTFSDKFLTKINVWAHNWRQLYSLFAFCDSFEPALCFSGIGIELECFLVVANGSIGHVLLLALFSQECVFGSQSFQCFVAFIVWRVASQCRNDCGWLIGNDQEKMQSRLGQTP